MMRWWGPGSRAKMVRDGKLLPRDDREVVWTANSLPGRHIALLLKLHEEVQEVAQAPTDVDEYADVLEVLLALADLHGLSMEAIMSARERKLRALGGFRRALVWCRDATRYEEQSR